VRTVQVGGGEGDWTEVPGQVEASETAAIASRVAATVESVRVEEGDAVRAGTVLVRLDARDLRARAQAAETALRAAEAQQERVRTLFSREAATQQELEAAEAAAAAARAERDAARAQLDYADLRAPFDGVVTGKRAQAGDLALPGRTILTVQGRGTMRVVASVSEAQAASLGIGQTLVAVRDDGGLVGTRLSVLSPAGDPGSRRFLIKADADPGAGMRAGSFVRLRLPGGAGAGAGRLLVPRSALVERGALTGLFVVEDGRARLRWISPGEPAGDAIEARSGLAAGEEVVVDPAGLVDGAPVAREAPPEEPGGR
jgi:RND family efflux transporter MFP subunit